MRIVTFRNELMCGLFLSPSYQSIESEQMSWGDQFFNDDDSVYDWRGEDQWWHQPLLVWRRMNEKLFFEKKKKKNIKRFKVRWWPHTASPRLPEPRLRWFLQDKNSKHNLITMNFIDKSLQYCNLAIRGFGSFSIIGINFFLTQKLRTCCSRMLFEKVA